MKRKYIFGGIASFLFMVLLLYICIAIFFTGTKLWGTIVPHCNLYVDDIESVETYNDYYKQTPDPNVCYESSPAYTKSDLFGRECHFIFYGKVLSCDNYVFKEKPKKDSKNPITYACHTVKLSVERGIYGHLKKGQEVYLLCRWHYTPKDSAMENNYINEGKKGIFITNGLPVKIHFNQTDTSIVAIGSLRHTQFSLLYGKYAARGFKRSG